MLADYTFKILMLGDASVGKTTLTHKYVTGVFLDSPRLTIGVDFFTKKVITNDQKRIKLQMWDFGGEERFRFLLPTYSKGSNAAFFLYDITSKNSLKSVNKWIPIIRENAGSIPIILLGSKLDLEEYRAVEYAEAQKMADQNMLAAHLQISAKTGVNIEESFKLITQMLLERFG